jgi:alginate O-acetyltransferase complex protein AlgI
MLFTSPIFLLFLPIIVIAHAMIGRRRPQNVLLLVANFIFYAAWDIRFCLLIAASATLDFVIGHAIHGRQDPTTCRRLLCLSLAANLGVLGFFKYFNFFVDSAVIALATLGLDFNTSTLNIILPVGISFYTFQTLSYTIDIYRRNIRPHDSFVEYLVFVSFFPQLVAGPIERASHLLPQFTKARSFDRALAISGCRLFLWGMFKKMALADNLARVVDPAFASPESATGGVLAVATIAFAFQIYGDFSGYSDMAAGMARLMGIDLQRNFAYPYFAASLNEFWRRWHISLSTWFRDYVYIPLGGSRRDESTTIRNLTMTFLLSGLWHGAAWNFIIWGAYHGLLLVLERVMGANASHHCTKAKPTGSPVSHPTSPGEACSQSIRSSSGRTHTGLSGVRRRLSIGGTFLLVSMGWILFRSSNLDDAFSIYSQIFRSLPTVAFPVDVWSSLSQHKITFILLVIALGIEAAGRHAWNPIPILPARWMRWTTDTLLFWSILIFGTRQSTDFIYFQF